MLNLIQTYPEVPSYRKEYLDQKESIKNSRLFNNLDVLLVQLSSLYWRPSSGDFPYFVFHLMY